MNRRKLIAGVAMMAGSHALPLALPAEQKPSRSASPLDPGARKRQAPERPVVLRNRELEIVFDREHGLPYAYHYRGQSLWGESEGQPIRAIVCKLEPREYQTITLLSTSLKQTEHSVNFTFRMIFAGSEAASFTLCYRLETASLVVTMEAVEEQAGFVLIEAALPQLVTVREEEGPAWMAEGRNGGSFVWLQNAKRFRFPDDEYFGRISTELPIGMVGQNDIGCVMEVSAYMDGTETEVHGDDGHRYATLGTVQTHRVHGGRCYNMNDGGSPVCGDTNTLNLLVGQTPRSRLDFFSCNKQPHPWLAGAKILRSRMPEIPTQFFSDRFLYIVAGKKKIESTPRTTFAQSRQLIQDVARLTDGAPQTIFISGWDYDGQDTGYPSEDKINTSLGSYNELRSLMEDAKLWNANVTLNTNYDDAYKSSPIFNDAFIARRPDGAIWKSRDWDGETSYVVGMAKFMEGGWGSRRIAYTMEHFAISDSILIDAMSWFAIRNDWDPVQPASGYKNLIEGKYKVLEQFKERGVAVTSEQLRYPFIGRLSVSMDGPAQSSCPFGGESIPLIPVVYRKAAIWGSAGARFNEPQHQLFWNTRSALWFQSDTDRIRMIDFYYLVVLPFSKLHALEVEDYKTVGTIRKLQLEQQAQITIDTATESYKAEIQGVVIASDHATSCPIDKDRIAFYSRYDRQLRYPLPSGWKASTLVARALSLQGSKTVDVGCTAGMITVDVKAGQPVIVYANRNVKAIGLLSTEEIKGAGARDVRREN